MSMLKLDKTRQNPQLKTLAIDIGGTGVKIMVLDARGKPLSERVRMPTPSPATPDAVLTLLDQMITKVPAFDRVSIGFPGVIKAGKTLTAHNLTPEWVRFPLEETIQTRWQKPTRLCNDAAVQGFGAIQGKGVELLLTFGTGLGSALFIDGRLCPGLELAHHPWRDGKTYEDFLGRQGLKKLGKKEWNRLVQKAIAQTAKLFNWDHLYIGGGNATKIEIQLPEFVSVVSNEDGLLGGVALWHND
jgi:polyphosphate glucokinase